MIKNRVINILNCSKEGITCHNITKYKKIIFNKYGMDTIKEELSNIKNYLKNKKYKIIKLYYNDIFNVYYAIIEV